MVGREEVMDVKKFKDKSATILLDRHEVIKLFNALYDAQQNREYPDEAEFALKLRDMLHPFEEDNK